MNVKRLIAVGALSLFTGLTFAQSPVTTGQGVELEPKLRAKIEAEWKKKAGPDGMITKQQFMQSMEGHWHTYEKRHSHAGKVKPEDMPRLMMFLSGQDASP